MGILKPVAIKYNLTLYAFGNEVTPGSDAGGQFVLKDAFDTALEPAPTTPTIDSAQYGLLAGTINAALLDSPSYDGSQIIVVPTLGLGEWIFLALRLNLT